MNDVTEKITVRLPALMEMLDCGRGSAERIAHESGAVIKIGKTKLYNVAKIKEYLGGIAKG